MDKKIHHGRNIKRFREMLGIKQEALAYDLGEEWTQKKISQLESKEEIESDLLKHVADVLKVPVVALETFDQDSAMNIIANTFTDFKDTYGLFNYHPTFNPIDKWLEALSKNEKLYERLLQTEREKVALLEKLLDKK